MNLLDAYQAMYCQYPDAVRTSQACEMLDLERHTLCHLIHTQQIFALRVGQGFLIPKSSIIEFLITGRSDFPMPLHSSGKTTDKMVSCRCSNGQTAC
ncbi:MAG: helix-turn-helix domain-containing protein [Faecalibacterium sp.]|jgi:excisionase family DNA binding protein|nr:helix-turn-helix domain-containing protein [Faecalibacterium sp.]